MGVTHFEMSTNIYLSPEYTVIINMGFVLQFQTKRCICTDIFFSQMIYDKCDFGEIKLYETNIGDI